jgi:hypothetical protein
LLERRAGREGERESGATPTGVRVKGRTARKAMESGLPRTDRQQERRRMAGESRDGLAVPAQREAEVGGAQPSGTVWTADHRN